MFAGKKLLVFLGLIAGVIFLSAGCTTAQRETEDNVKNNGDAVAAYTIADATGDWGFPAPYTHYLRGPGYIRMSFVFDTLVWKDNRGFTGALAEEWRYLQEENAYIFNLRKDVKWHDGEEFTARDVLFTFQYLKKHPYAWVDAGIIKKVTAPDTYSVKVFLERPYAPFLANIAGTLPVLPAHIYQNIDDPESRKDRQAATGTGPYKLVDYNREHGTYLYEAYADYYLGKPKVDKIRFIKISGQMTPAALLDGTAGAGEVPPEMVNKFREQGFKVLLSGHDWNAKLMFNHNQEPFADKKFRQAVAYAIDRDKLVEISQRGHALKGSPGLLPPDNPWYAPESDKYDHDPEKSRELFAALGYQYNDGRLQKEGKPLTLELLIKSRFSRDAELIKTDLEKVGIRVIVSSLEDKTVDTKIKNWNFQMAVSGHGGLGGDPEILNKVVAGDSFNSARYQKSEMLTGLLLKQTSVLDDKEREKIVAGIQKIYAEELPTLTLYYPDNYWAHDGRLDLYYTPQGVAGGIPIALNKLSFVK